MSNRNRTSKGNVTAEARRKYGEDDGSFPIFDKKSAMNALKLRGHADRKEERRSIIRRAAKYAPEAAQKALDEDKKNGKI